MGRESEVGGVGEGTSLWTSEEIEIMKIDPSEHLTIYDADEEMVARIHFSGELELGEGYTPDEAAQAFWEALRLYAPEPRRDALLAEAAEVLRAFPWEVQPQSGSSWKWWNERAQALLDALEGNDE